MKKVLILLLVLTASACFGMGEMPMYPSAHEVSQDKANCPIELTEVIYIPSDYPSLTLAYKNVSKKTIKGAYARVTAYDGNDEVINFMNIPYTYCKFHGENIKPNDSMRKTFDFIFMEGIRKFKIKITKVYYTNGKIEYFK